MNRLTLVIIGILFMLPNANAQRLRKEERQQLEEARQEHVFQEYVKAQDKKRAKKIMVISEFTSKKEAFDHIVNNLIQIDIIPDKINNDYFFMTTEPYHIGKPNCRIILTFYVFENNNRIVISVKGKSYIDNVQFSHDMSEIENKGMDGSPAKASFLAMESIILDLLEIPYTEKIYQ